jgi:hypothetical protein
MNLIAGARVPRVYVVNNKMNKVYIIFLALALNSCSGNSCKKANDSLLNSRYFTKSNKTKPSNYGKKSIDSLIRAGVISQDDLNLPPLQSEERERLKKEYDKIKVIDSTFINDKDTLLFHLKYYCLKDSNLVIPKFYDTEDKIPKEFITHPFVADISLTNNGHTVLNRQFKASDFAPFFVDNFGGNFKKYGSLLPFQLTKRNKDKNRIVLTFSYSIPVTDLGISLYLIIFKNGSYKVVENL